MDRKVFQGLLALLRWNLYSLYIHILINRSITLKIFHSNSFAIKMNACHVYRFRKVYRCRRSIDWLINWILMNINVEELFSLLASPSSITTSSKHRSLTIAHWRIRLLSSVRESYFLAKGQKDLFQCRLRDGVRFNLQLFFVLLE